MQLNAANSVTYSHEEETVPKGYPCYHDLVIENAAESTRPRKLQWGQHPFDQEKHNSKDLLANRTARDSSDVCGEHKLIPLA